VIDHMSESDLSHLTCMYTYVHIHMHVYQDIEVPVQSDTCCTYDVFFYETVQRDTYRYVHTLPYKRTHMNSTPMIISMILSAPTKQIF
jgi:hypothetical protein